MAHLQRYLSHASLRLRVEDSLNIEGDIHLVTDDNLGIRGQAKGDAEIAAHDGAAGRETDPGLALQSGWVDAEELDLKLGRPGDRPDRQVAGKHPQAIFLTQARAGEGQRGRVPGIEEVCRAKMVVPHLIAGTDRRERDGCGRGAEGRVTAGNDLAIDLAERSADPAHQVPCGEGHYGVRRIDRPGSCGPAR